MSKIILERISQLPINLPSVYQNLNFKDFGIGISLYDFQQQALKNLINCLFRYYSNKGELFNQYKYNGLDEELENHLSIGRDDANFSFLSNYYPVHNNRISFEHIINRASFWMATGSGKTLVIVKLVEILYELMNSNCIPKNDILILAPRKEILKQIKDHVAEYNKSGRLQIELRDLREWERMRFQGNLFSANRVTIFFYRAGNISEENKIELVDYKTYLNNGNWYLLLDEAHKGDKEFSVKQQYYTALSKNGFLFNFSATFTDDLDIITTVFNFNLKKFIENGYGKHIKVTDEEFKSFNRRKDSEFTLREKQNIVLKSLITLTAIKKQLELIRKIKKNAYHNPLLITLANSVNTIEADLKIFFQELAKIVKKKIDISSSKKELVESLESSRAFQFDYGEEINDSLLTTIRGITYEEILKYVFNCDGPGTIEVVKILANNRELAFRMTTAHKGKPFGLLVASDAVLWQKNTLKDYSISTDVIKDSFFSEINDSKNDISILLGSRIFVEGWDSNRPNVVNFINIGVDEDAIKYVLQATGRGVRIEPFKKQRKRLSEIPNHDQYLSVEEYQSIESLCQGIEALLLFATNKEVVSKIIEHLNRNISDNEWVTIKGIEKNNIKEDLLIPIYVDSSSLNDKPYRISKKDYERTIDYIKANSEKVLLVEHDLKIRTFNKLLNTASFKFEGPVVEEDPLFELQKIDRHFNKIPKVLSHYEPVTDEIKHYKHIQIKNFPSEELGLLEKEIKAKLNIHAEDNLKRKLQKGEITVEEYTQELKQILYQGNHSYSHKIDYKNIKEHYYNPILLSRPGFENFFKHIIKVESEQVFLSKLEQCASKTNSILKSYDWWYFSKLDEIIDMINIPYFDTEKQEYRNFCPDFIFWTRKGKAYKVTFVDPKGTEIPRNAVCKINGFNEIFQTKKDYKSIPIDCKLFYYNDREPVELKKELEKYWTSDFNLIFR